MSFRATQLILHFRNRLLHALFFILCLGLFSSCLPQGVIRELPRDLPPKNIAYPRILGAQVTLFEAKDYEEFGRSLDRMRAAGVNTLIFRVFQNPGDRRHGFIKSRARIGVYFRTDKAPVVEDILGRVCSMAHTRGMRVFAWMTTRQCRWLLEERPDLAGWMFDPGKGEVLRASGLDLFHPEVVAYLQELFADLARAPIDGILFQDDLVLRHTEGLGPEAARLYGKTFGRDLTPSHLFTLQEGRLQYKPEFWRWTAWKNRRILRVIDSIVERVSQEKEGLYWALNSYYESLTAPKNALAWYAQDLEKSLAHRIDYLAVMAYHRQIMDELGIDYDQALNLLTEMSREAVAITGDPDRVLMKVQTLDWKTESSLEAEEIQEVFDALLEGGRTGLVYVRGKNPPPLVPVQKAFSR